MPCFWAEDYDGSRHQNKMEGFDLPPTGQPTIAPRKVFFVSACSFTFEFHSLDQLRATLAFYERKIHPSTRRHIGGADHWECERWFERLPMHLREEPRRIRIVSALERALAEFTRERHSGHS